ncbi:cytochrome P450 [Irpex lacteus]|nr:cytochrome P450 [Irpex lacteus]
MRTSTFFQQSMQELTKTVVGDTRVEYVTVLLLFVTAYLLLGIYRRRHKAPGPRRLPILGNLLQMPTDLQFVQFSQWAQKYGPIYSLDALGRHIVVLNTYEAAGDLFDRRSNIYNDRPRLVMASEILGRGAFLPLLKNEEPWRRMRRAVHEDFNARAVEQYRTTQREATILALLRILQNPNAWEENLQTINASAICNSVYGWPPFEPGAPLLKHIQDFIAYGSKAALPGAHLVDIFPIMKHIPASMAQWKRKAMKWHEDQDKVFKGFRVDAVEKTLAGELSQNFVSQIILDGNKHGLSEKELTWLPGMLFLGGTDTTFVAIINCVLAMLHYPDVMRRAHEELDTVVGRERAPTFADKDSLPYIQAIVYETLRWRPPLPLGIPHVATESSWYKGYFIPKGTIVIGNIWAMNRDPSVHTDFDTFRPERYLGASGKVEVVPADTHQMGHTSYGFGKRICPGMYYANQALFIGLATMLWAFDIQPCLDEKGEAILPPTDEWVDAGFVVRPASFDCNFTPRFSGVREILESIETG